MGSTLIARTFTIRFEDTAIGKDWDYQGFSTVFFLFPSPPQKKIKERVAAVARERQSGNMLLIHLEWGLATNQSDF